MGSEGFNPLHCLKRAYEMLNVGGAGGKMNRSDLAALLHTMEALPPNEGDGSNVEKEITQLMSEIDQDKDGMLSFEDIRGMMHMQRYSKANTNRHFVALSLEEAEFVRAIMHATLPVSSNEVTPSREPERNIVQQRKATTISTASLFANTDLALGLRINGRVLLDITGNYTSPPHQQLATSAQCYRFLNSELHYNTADVGALLRVLHDTPSVRREAFFNEVRSCRRRVQREWKETAVAPVISQQDEYTWLEFHAIISAIRTRIKKKNMRLMDAFRAFDNNRDGTLSCSELYGGLEWLGMKLSPQDIYAVVRHVDTFKDGRIRYVDWEAALRDPSATETDEESDSQQPAEFGNLDIQPKQIEELYVSQADLASRHEEIHDAALREIKIKVKEITSWRQVWSSEGTGARTHVTIWTAHISQHVVFRRNKYKINLGHYAVVIGAGHHLSLKGTFHLNKNAKTPSHLKGSTIELTDLDVSTLSKSSNLDEAHVNYLMPHPIGYKMTWWQQSSSDTGNLYVWKPIPPNDDFVSLGFVATTSNLEPPPDLVRCVNKGFLVPSPMKPEKIWDNAGTGGKKGSFWVVNSLGLLVVTESHDPPTACFELKSQRFIAADSFVLSAPSQPALPPLPTVPQSGYDEAAPPVPTRPNKQLPAKPPPAQPTPPPIHIPPVQPIPPSAPLPALPVPTLAPTPTLLTPTPIAIPSTAPPNLPDRHQRKSSTTSPVKTLQPPPPFILPIPTSTTPPPLAISNVTSKPVPLKPPPTPPTVNIPPPVTTSAPTPPKTLPLQPPLLPTVTHSYAVPAPPPTQPSTPNKKSASAISLSTPNPGAPVLKPPPPSPASLKAVPSPFVLAQQAAIQSTLGKPPPAYAQKPPPVLPSRPPPPASTTPPPNGNATVNNNGSTPQNRQLPYKPPPPPRP